MNSPAHDIALYLDGLSLGHFIGAPVGSDYQINVGKEPTDPDNTITIYDTGGEGADTDEQDIQNPTFQIRVRSKSYTSAWSKQEAIRTALAGGVQPKTMATSSVHIKEAPDIEFLARDENDRFLLIANYRAIRS